MNAKELMEAMNEIDDKYIRRAAPRRGSASRVGGVVLEVFKWAGGVAAAVALVFGLLTLGNLQTRPVSTAGAGGESAAVKEAPTPLEDLPPLIFPTREDWEAWRAGDDHSIRTADYMEPGQTVDLVAADFNFASLWGEDRLFWENRDLEEEFEFGGFAVYGQDGSLWYVHLSGYPKDPAARYVSAPLFELYLSPGGKPPEFNEAPDLPERANDIWGTNVSARYWETEKGDTIEDFHDYEASFFIVGDEPIGARITGYAVAGDSYYPDGEIVDLLTRFVSHSLRPGNTFTLSPLAEPPEVPAHIQEQEKMAEMDARAQAEAEQLKEEWRTMMAEMEARTQAEAEQKELMNEAVEQAAAYVEDMLDEWRRNSPAGEVNECFFQNLRITHISEDEQSMILSLRLVFQPTVGTETDGFWWAGNTKAGTGENEGYLTAARQVLVNKIDDRWEFGGSFTGGMSTEGYQEVNIPLGDQLTESKLLDLADKAQAGTLTLADFAPFAWTDQPHGSGVRTYPMPDGFEMQVCDGVTFPFTTSLLHPDVMGHGTEEFSAGREAVEAFLQACKNKMSDGV